MTERFDPARLEAIRTLEAVWDDCCQQRGASNDGDELASILRTLGVSDEEQAAAWQPFEPVDPDEFATIQERIAERRAGLFRRFADGQS